MVFSVTSFAQTVLQTKVTISFSEQTLDKALQQLQKKTGVNFAYTQDDVQSLQVLKLSFTNEPLENVCREIFKNTSLSFKESGGYIVISRTAQGPVEKSRPASLSRAGSPILKQKMSWLV